MMSEEEILRVAADTGKRHGRLGGAWRFDGNTDYAVFHDCIELDEAGDPEWWDVYGPRSDLLFPLADLAALGLDPETMPIDLKADVNAAYLDGFREGWHEEVMGVAHRAVQL